MTLAICFLAACLAGEAQPFRSVTYSQDVFAKHGITERLFLAESHYVLAGIAQQDDTGFLVGAVPLEIRAGRIVLHGGGLYSTEPLPLRGTRWNFLARASVRLTERLFLRYDHLSNAGLGDANPSVNAAGFGVVF